MNTVKPIAFAMICVVVLSYSLHAAPSADDALAILKDGNARYIAELAKHPDQTIEHRKELIKGQTPFVTILSCSDSRVPPEIIFDQGLGDVFSVRVAGNVADTDEIGSIEYGVGHLNTPLLIVMGHAKCGAVTAVVKGDKVDGSIPQLVSHIVPAVNEARATGATGDELLDAAITLNVWHSISDIFTKSEEVRNLVGKGKLKVIGAVYDLESGKIRWLGESPDQGKLLGTLETATPAEIKH
jgi:carbonic anhydrase